MPGNDLETFAGYAWFTCPHCCSIPEKITTCCQCNGIRTIDAQKMWKYVYEGHVWARMGCHCNACEAIRNLWWNGFKRKSNLRIVS